MVGYNIILKIIYSHTLCTYRNVLVSLNLKQPQQGHPAHFYQIKLTMARPKTVEWSTYLCYRYVHYVQQNVLSSNSKEAKLSPDRNNFILSYSSIDVSSTILMTDLLVFLIGELIIAYYYGFV